MGCGGRSWNRAGEGLRPVVKRRNFRCRDPAFKQAIAAAAQSEAQHGRSDPLDGEVVIGELVDDELVEGLGPAQTEIHRLLRG